MSSLAVEDADKNVKIQLARDARQKRLFNEEAQIWEKIVKLDVQLTAQELEECSDVCTPLILQLSKDELPATHVERFLEHARSVLKIVDSLAIKLSSDQAQNFFLRRWFSHRTLQQRSVEASDVNLKNTENVVFEALPHIGMPASQRFTLHRYWLLCTDDAEKRKAELSNILESVCRATASTEMVESEKKLCARIERQTKDDLDWWDEKEVNIIEAKQVARDQRFLDQLLHWMEILDRRVELSFLERREAIGSCTPLVKKLAANVYRELEESLVVEWTRLALGVLDGISQMTVLHHEEQKSMLAKLRWENEEVLKSLGWESVDRTEDGQIECHLCTVCQNFVPCRPLLLHEEIRQRVFFISKFAEKKRKINELSNLCQELHEWIRLYGRLTRLPDELVKVDGLFTRFMFEGSLQSQLWSHMEAMTGDSNTTAGSKSNGGYRINETGEPDALAIRAEPATRRYSRPLFVPFSVIQTNHRIFRKRTIRSDEGFEKTEEIPTTETSSDLNMQELDINASEATKEDVSEPERSREGERASMSSFVDSASRLFSNLFAEHLPIFAVVIVSLIFYLALSWSANYSTRRQAAIARDEVHVFLETLAHDLQVIKTHSEFGFARVRRILSENLYAELNSLYEDHANNQ